MQGPATLLMGDLDRLFTVLFEMGKVEPLLKKDWKPLYKHMMHSWPEVKDVIHKINSLQNIPQLKSYLQELRPDLCDAIVLEVAREMAEFYDRKTEELH